MGNTASQIEQLASKQANLEKQLSVLTVNIDKLVTGLTEMQYRGGVNYRQDDECPDITIPLLDPTVVMFERELTSAERGEFISNVVTYLTQNSSVIIENKDNQYGKSIAEIVNKVGIILCSNPTIRNKIV